MTIVQTNLRRIIVEKDLKKKAVATRAGITQQAFSDILAGRKVIRADMIPALAGACGVEIPELFKEDQGARGA